MLRQALENLRAWRDGWVRDWLDARAFHQGLELRSTAARLRQAIQRSEKEQGDGHTTHGDGAADRIRSARD